MEQLDYNTLFRWFVGLIFVGLIFVGLIFVGLIFVGLNMDDLVWDVTVFTKNERLLDGDIAEAFF